MLVLIVDVIHEVKSSLSTKIRENFSPTFGKPQIINQPMIQSLEAFGSLLQSIEEQRHLVFHHVNEPADYC